MVHNDIPVTDGVVEDALSARSVDVVVRAEDVNADRRAGCLRQEVVVLVGERTGDALAAADENLVLLARGGTRVGRLSEKNRMSLRPVEQKSGSTYVGTDKRRETVGEE